MAELAYILCFLTSTAVAILLLRSYRLNGHRILLWSSLGFVGLALNNGLLIVDKLVVPTQVDLSIIRQTPAMIGLGLMVFGMIWDDR